MKGSYMADDPIDGIRKLGQRFIEEMEKLGLHVHTFAVLPNFDGGPHMIQAALTFDGDEVDEKVGKADAVLSPEEAKMFDDMQRDLQRSTEEEKAQDAADGLRKLAADLERPQDGILGDDDDD